MNNKTIKILAGAALLVPTVLIGNNTAFAKGNEKINDLLIKAQSTSSQIKLIINDSALTPAIQSSKLEPLYNSLKKSIQTIKIQVKLTAGSNQYTQKKLELLELEVLKTAKYIDSIKEGAKLLKLNGQLQYLLLKPRLDDSTIKLYDDVSSEIKKTEKVISKVYGSSNREKLLKFYVNSAKITKEGIKYEITMHLLLKKLDRLIADKHFKEAKILLPHYEPLVSNSALIKKRGNELYPGSYPAYQEFNSILTAHFNEIQKAVNDESASKPPVVIPDGTTTPSVPPIVIPDSGTIPGGGGTQPEDNGTNIKPVPLNGVITEAGTYGTEKDKVNFKGNIVIKGDNVILKNVNLDGDLTLTSEVKDGSFEVNGISSYGRFFVEAPNARTLIKDSLVDQVIIKPGGNGSVITAEGKSNINNTIATSTSNIHEKNIGNESSGFKDIVTSATAEESDSFIFLTLVGDFEHVISNRLTSFYFKGDIKEMHLNAGANFNGEAVIEKVTVNTLKNIELGNIRPENLILLSNTTNVLRHGSTVNKGWSAKNRTTLENAELMQDSIFLKCDSYNASITLSDLKIAAKIDGTAITLSNLRYNPSLNQISFTPVKDAVGKTLEVTVEPKKDSEKLIGGPVSKTIIISNGFSGKIIDENGAGVANLPIVFKDDTGNKMINAVTDPYGNFYQIAEPGKYKGTIRKEGYADTSIYAEVSGNQFKSNILETLVPAPKSKEHKFLLEWDNEPADLDFHLISTKPGGVNYSAHASYKSINEWNNDQQMLGWDDQDSFGPEVMSLSNIPDGKYLFYVHNYSNEKALSDSKAAIRILSNEETLANQVVSIPAGSSSKRYWKAFELVVSNKGTHFKINKIDKYTDYIEEDRLISEINQFENNLSQAISIITKVNNKTFNRKYSKEAFQQLEQTYNEVQPKFDQELSFGEVSILNNSIRNALSLFDQSTYEVPDSFIHSSLQNLQQEISQILNDNSHLEPEIKAPMLEAQVKALNNMYNKDLNAEEVAALEKEIKEVVRKFITEHAPLKIESVESINRGQNIIDLLKVTFNQNVLDSSLTPEKFTLSEGKVKGIGSFSNWDDKLNDKIIYLAVENIEGTNFTGPLMTNGIGAIKNTYNVDLESLPIGIVIKDKAVPVFKDINVFDKEIVIKFSEDVTIENSDQLKREITVSGLNQPIEEVLYQEGSLYIRVKDVIERKNNIHVQYSSIHSVIKDQNNNIMRFGHIGN